MTCKFIPFSAFCRDGKLVRFEAEENGHLYGTEYKAPLECRILDETFDSVTNEVMRFEESIVEVDKNDIIQNVVIRHTNLPCCFNPPSNMTSKDYFCRLVYITDPYMTLTAPDKLLIDEMYDEAALRDVFDYDDSTLTAGDLCCGLGGSSNAAEKIELRVKWGIDHCEDCIDTYQHMIDNDAYQLSVEELEQRIQIEPGWRVNILMATPPCQGFTLANTTGSEASRAAINSGFHASGRVVALLRPEIAILENVPGLLSHRHERDLAKFTCVLVNAGYKVKYGTFNCSEYNVAQKRKRVILYAAGPGIELPVFPCAKTFTPSVTDSEYNVKMLMSGLLPVPTLRNAFDDLSKASALFPYNHEIDWTRYPVDSDEELDWDGLAPTVQNITSQWKKTHPDGGRVLSVRECARLQTLPDGLEICGSRSSQYRQVGNATPPEFFKEFLMMAREAIMLSR